jgi:hypothetical protein
MDEKQTSTGMGFLSTLLIAFIILKLCNQIDWSWWWVLSPLWIPIALIILFMLIKILIDHL